MMDIKEKIALIKRNTVEIVTEEELEKLLKEKKQPVTYCGYEPSGPIHLGHLVTLTKLMDLQKAGFKVKILLADIHAFLNKKGDFKKIEQEMEHWSKGIKALGLKADVPLMTSPLRPRGLIPLHQCSISCSIFLKSPFLLR